MHGMTFKVWLWVCVGLAGLFSGLVQAQRLTLQARGPEGGEWAHLARLTDGSLIAAAGQVLYRSTNHGLSWAPLVPPSGSSAAVSALTASSQGVFLRKGAALYASDDSGQTWRSCAGGIGNTIEIALDGVQTFYVTTSTGLWASTDGCRSFVQRRTETTLIKIAANATELLWSNSSGGLLMRSTDGGVTAQQVGSFGSIWAMALTPGGTALVADLSNIYQRANPQASFVVRHTTSNTVTKLANLDGNWVGVGFGGAAYSTDNGTTFSNWSLPGGTMLAVSVALAADGSTLLGTSSHLFRAASVGAAFAPADSALTAIDVRGLSHSAGITYLNGRMDVRRSLDGGQSWSSARDGLPIGYGTSSLAQDAAGDAYLVGPNILHWRSPSASTWTSMRTTQLNGSQVAADPDGIRIHFTHSSALQWSDNRGTTITPANFPDGFFNAVYLRAGGLNRVYAATSQNIARSLDGGQSYLTLNTLLPSGFIINSLVADPLIGTAWVGDFIGGGIYYLDPWSNGWAQITTPPAAEFGTNRRVLWAGRDRLIVGTSNGLWVGRGRNAQIAFEKAPVWPANCANPNATAAAAAEVAPGKWLVGTSACSTFLLTDPLIFADGFN